MPGISINQIYFMDRDGMTLGQVRLFSKEFGSDYLKRWREKEIKVHKDQDSPEAIEQQLMKTIKVIVLRKV